MKKFFSILLAMLGLNTNTACEQVDEWGCLLQK